MAGASNFIERLDELAVYVTEGTDGVTVTGTVGFGRNLANYAIPQHQAYWENYYSPGLGRHVGFKTMFQPLSHYLSGPVDDQPETYVEQFAVRVIDEGAYKAMDAAMEALENDSRMRAPERSGDLKRSAYRQVD